MKITLMLLALVAIVGLSQQQGAVAQRRFLRRLKAYSTCTPQCYHGKCVGSTCICPAGYSGKRCETFTQHIPSNVHLNIHWGPRPPQKPAFRNCNKASLERLFDAQPPVTTKTVMPKTWIAARKECSLGMAMGMCERCFGDTACIKARIQSGGRALMVSTPKCKRLLRLQWREVIIHGFVPGGTFKTCDELKTFGVREGGSSVQCSNMLVDSCCNECLHDQADARCMECIDQSIIDNYEAMVANQCITELCENDLEDCGSYKRYESMYWIGMPYDPQALSWFRSMLQKNPYDMVAMPYPKSI